MTEKDFDNIRPDSPLGKPRMFYELLAAIIKPKNVSDRTVYWKICLWVERKCQHNVFQQDIFDRIADYAKEATGPDCRNPVAVFVSILKKELNYPN